MKGFLAGSLALIILEVIVQSGPSNKIQQSGNVVVAGLKHFLSPSVAGVGNHAKTATGTVATPSAIPPASPAIRYA